jgi:hypothetical protein
MAAQPSLLRAAQPRSLRARYGCPAWVRARRYGCPAWVRSPIRLPSLGSCAPLWLPSIGSVQAAVAVRLGSNRPAWQPSGAAEILSGNLGNHSQRDGRALQKQLLVHVQITKTSAFIVCRCLNARPTSQSCRAYQRSITGTMLHICHRTGAA